MDKLGAPGVNKCQKFVFTYCEHQWRGFLRLPWKTYEFRYSLPLSRRFIVSFTSSVHSITVDRRIDHSLRLEVVFVLRFLHGEASGQVTNNSTLSTPPPLNIDRTENNELHELVRTITRRYGMC